MTIMRHFARAKPDRSPADAVSLVLATICVAAVCVAGLAAHPSLAAAASGDECVDVHYVAVRGSGEEGGRTGHTARDIYRSAKDTAPPETTTKLSGIDYAAVGVDFWGVAKELASGHWRYQSSKSGGARNLAAVIDQRTDACPDEHWVLLGYSQGAHVIEDAISTRTGALTQDQRDRLRAIVLIASPRFNPNETHNAGSYEHGREGFLGERRKGDLQELSTITLSICDAGDLVCQGGVLENRTNGVHDGRRYADDHRTSIRDHLQLHAWRDRSAAPVDRTELPTGVAALTAIVLWNPIITAIVLLVVLSTIRRNAVAIGKVVLVVIAVAVLGGYLS
jgi:pimeloyl-ACP methyl ester carboxylesterase